MSSKPKTIDIAGPYATPALDRVRALRALIEGCAARDEEATQLADEVCTALYEAGLFALMAPREVGGEEAHPDTMIDVIRELSYYDGSTGWYVGAVTTGAAVSGAYLGERAIDAIYRSGPIKLCAGQAVPSGRAVREGDHYRISGRYTFGSGTPSASFCVGGYHVYEGDKPVLGENGQPIHLIGLAPREHVRFHGNWDVIGLRATGSYDFEVCEHLLHEDHFLQAGVARAKRGGTLYKIGFMAIPCLHHGSWAIGVAQRALDEWLAIAQAKKRPDGFAHEAKTMQRDYAVAQGELRAAEAYYRKSYSTLFERVEAGANREEIEALHLDARLSTSNAVLTGTRVTQTAFTACTTLALRDGNMIQRCFRDSQAGNAHILTGETSFIEAGRMLVGLDEKIFF
jgi:alkylation response protein AidB-like acyl-CoA dehydrogenase